MTTIGAGYKIESSEARALRSINAESYDYRDQAKLLSKMVGDVTYMAQYMRQMQKGIDEANQNIVEQILGFISEIGSVVAGNGDTGFEFGDVKYVFQAWGALFGFDTTSGIGSIFPINLFSAAWHFLSTYVLPLNNFGEAIDEFIDAAIATMLDVVGEIPIVGQAAQIFATWVVDLRDGVTFMGGLFSDWTSSFVQSIKNTISSVQNIVDWFTGSVNSAISNLFTWAKKLPIMINDLLHPNNVPSLDASKIGSGIFNTSAIPNLDGSKITTGTISTGRIPGLPAGQIISGTFNTAQIPSLDASKIATGTLGPAVIPSLDASKITTGTLPQSMVSNLPTDLVAKASNTVINTMLAAGGNLCNNPGFEDGSLINGGIMTNAVARTGTYSLQLTGTGNYVQGYLVNKVGGGAASIITAPGEKFYIEGYVYGKSTNVQTTGGSGGIAVYGVAYNSLGNVMSYPTDAALTLTAGTSLNNTWTKISGYITMPATTARTTFFVQLNTNVPAGENYYFDDFIIRQATESAATNTALYGSNTPSSTITSSAVPAIDASKITTGTFGSTLIPSLDASKVTTGTLGTARIPSLDASKVTTGTFSQSMVTNLPALTTLVSTKAASGSNICLDPSFETDALWTNFSGVQDSTIKRSGFRSRKITTTASAQALYFFNNGYGAGTTITVFPGETYFVSAWLYSPSSNTVKTGVISSTLTDSTSTNAAQYPNTGTITLLDDTWTQLSFYYTIPSGYNTWNVYGWFSQAAGNVYYVDDIQVREVTESVGIKQGLYATTTVQSTILASKVPSLDASKVTTGTFSQSMVTNLSTDLSSKVPTTVFDSTKALGSNLATDPGFENTSIPVSSSSYVTRSTEIKRSGAYSAKIATPGTSYLSVLMTRNTAGTSNSFRCTPGDVYYVEAWVYGKSTNVQTGSAGEQAIALFAQWQTEASVHISYTDAQSWLTANTSLNGVWTKMSGYVTAPANAYQFIVYVQVKQGVAAGEVYYVDDMVLKETTESIAIKQGLYGANTVSSTILASKVPSLDASKITTGTLSTTNIPNLDASKITTGSFGSSQITDGAVSTTKLADASVSSAKIIDGSVNTAELADAAVTGVKTTGLDASKVTTGTLGTGVIPNITKSMSTDLQSTINNIYQGWYGSAGSGTVAEVQQTLANVKETITGGWTIQVLTTSATWSRPWTVAPLDFWCICIGGGGGGGKGTLYSPWTGGYGAYGGGYCAQQIDVAIIPSTVTYTIGAGAAGKTSGTIAENSGNITSFGSLASSNVTTGSIASIFGFYDATSSSPGKGGNGGNGKDATSGVLTNGEPGGSTPLASGGTAGAGASNGNAGSGLAGGNASLSGNTRCGGGGGGGGGGARTGYGGSGGNGGYPGGGGGGGGGSNQYGSGNGGTGGNGAIILLWK